MPRIYEPGGGAGGGGGGTWGYHFSEPRPLTNRERARLFGYEDDFVFIGSITEVRKQIGNSVPPPAARILAEHLLPALKAKTFKNPGTFARLEPKNTSKPGKKTTQRKLTQRVV